MKAQRREQARSIEWPEMRPVCMRHKEEGEWWVMGTWKDFTNSKKNRVVTTAMTEAGFFLLTLYPLWVQPGAPDTIPAFQEGSPSPLNLHQLQQVVCMVVTSLLIMGYCRFINIRPLLIEEPECWVQWGCWLIIITLTYAFFLIVKECRHRTFIFKNK